TPCESTLERPSASRQLAGVVGRARFAFAGAGVRVKSGVPGRSMAAAASFASSLILLVIEVMPSSGGYLAGIIQFRDRHPGLSAMISLTVIVSGASLIHRQKWQVIRYLVVPLATASGVLAIARWPVFFPDSPAATSIQALSILGLAWILAK